MPPALRGVLHCAIDLLADPGNAGRKAGRRALCAARCGTALQAVRRSTQAGGVRLAEAVGGDVRNDPGARADLAYPPRSGNGHIGLPNAYRARENA